MKLYWLGEANLKCWLFTFGRVSRSDIKILFKLLAFKTLAAFVGFWLLLELLALISPVGKTILSMILAKMLSDFPWNNKLLKRNCLIARIFVHKFTHSTMQKCWKD